MGNQKPYTEGQTMQWLKEKGQKIQALIYKNTTCKTKNWAIRNALKLK